MFGQALVRPRRAGLKIVIVGVEPHKVNRKFSANDQLLQIRFLGRLGSVSFLDSQSHGVRTDVPKMQIGRKTAGAIALRLVAINGIIRQSLTYKSLQPLKR